MIGEWICPIGCHPKGWVMGNFWRKNLSFPWNTYWKFGGFIEECALLKSKPNKVVSSGGCCWGIAIIIIPSKAPWRASVKMQPRIRELTSSIAYRRGKWFWKCIFKCKQFSHTWFVGTSSTFRLAIDWNLNKSQHLYLSSSCKITFVGFIFV